MIKINGRLFASRYTAPGEIWQRPPYLPVAAQPSPPPKAANSNLKAASGKAAHQWPAMARATAGTLLDDPKSNRVAAAVLAGFAALYADVSIDPSAIPSPAGRIAELSLADVREGDDGDRPMRRGRPHGRRGSAMHDHGGSAAPVTGGCFIRHFAYSKAAQIS
ncbi:hypothetical protein [Aurantimonas sp. C2-3-R2]|uniref:hypothetical protein n=1 Tax=unclassified Aurantimonas TaxID=2638230 RepID=UPI003FA4C072